MAPYARSIQGYRNVSIGTASPDKLLMMVYKGALKFLNSAKIMMDKEQYDQAQAYVIKASSAVVELIATLDHSRSPDLANSLEKLYIYVLENLSKAVEERSSAKIEIAINIINTLTKTWEEAFEKMGKEAIQKTG